MKAPMPPAEPIFGHARLLARDPLGTLVRWMREYGPIVRFRVGRREAHVVYAPEAIRRVLSDPDGIYGKDTHGYRTLRLFVGDGLLTSGGARWVKQRRVLQPAFHRQSLAFQLGVMHEAAQGSANELAEARGTVMVDALATRVTLAIVGRAILGVDLDASVGAIGAAVLELQEAANRRITAPFTLPFAFPTPEHLRIRSARARLRTLLGRLVDAKQSGRPALNSPASMNAVDLLVHATDADTGESLPRELILDELVTLLVAGHESTANALGWALSLLARHPGELALVRREVDASRSSPVTLERLSHEPRLRAVVEETLRLFPPAWSFGRAPVRDDELSGYSVPAGGLVMIVPWATHRDATLFADPETFRPSRFLDAAPPAFSFLPFGGGPRTCIGHSFARAEAQVVLGEWIRHVDFDLVEGQDLTPRPLVTLRPRRGVAVRVEKRRGWS